MTKSLPHSRHPSTPLRVTVMDAGGDKLRPYALPSTLVAARQASWSAHLGRGRTWTASGHTPTTEIRLEKANPLREDGRQQRHRH